MIDHYSDGRRWSYIHNAWIFEESWNDKEEIAAQRATIEDLSSRLKLAENALLRHGYRKECDVTACNCGAQWNHGGHARQRLQEIDEVVPYENGKTILQRVEQQAKELAELKSRDPGFYGRACARLSRKNQTLREALSSLHNEVKGLIGIAESALRSIAGNTNVNCIQRRLEQAQAALQEESCLEK